MAGTTLIIDLDLQRAPERLEKVERLLASPGPLLAELGEYLGASTQDRFKAQVAPDGSTWQALSPRYLKRKRRNKDKILTLRGFLRGQIAYQVEGSDTVAVGTNRAYGAIHQFGGEISIAARSQNVYRRANKAGELSRKFAKKASKGAVAQRVTIGAHTIKMPARPFLGLSDRDRLEVRERTAEFLRELLSS
ncbi:phage virion morphogenesis protein [Caldimonas sp. KR1-144]|uniref:phage virion morphogenesis protein n=1 Tax=Caldimonas sp. KR1-144 TaxID=3400911 RepID=UPI003C0D12C2